MTHAIDRIERRARDVARAVRAELGGRTSPRLALMVARYQAYNPAVDAARFCRAALAAFPRGGCGLASLLIVDDLGEGAVIRGRFGSHAHTFVVVRGAVIVDVTADQFGGPAIYVGARRSPWSS